MKSLSYRDTVYAKYVSSGQARRLPGETDPEKIFKKHRPFIKHTILRHFPKSVDANILDIACGTGGYVFYAKQLGYKNILGIDISAEQVELAHSMGIMDVQHVDLFDFLKSCDRKYDCVLLVDILEHLTKDELFNLLTEIKKVLSPNARIIIHVPNAEGIYGMRVMYGDITHENCFTPFSLQQVLALNGFQLLHCFEDKPLIHSPYAFIRRIVWNFLTLYPRLLLFAETAQWNTVLSQNMTVIAQNTP